MLHSRNVLIAGGNVRTILICASSYAVRDFPYTLLFAFCAGDCIDHISCSAGNVLSYLEAFAGVCALDGVCKLSIMFALRAPPVGLAVTEPGLICAVRWDCLVCAFEVNLHISVGLEAAAANWAFADGGVWYGDAIESLC